MAERTTVIGRLGRDPRRKTTSRGEVVDFSLAQSSRVLGPDGRWSDGPTTWYEVSAWDRLAENAAASLQKGQPVLVHGTVSTDAWTDREGVVHEQLRIKAASIGHDLCNGTASFARGAAATRTPAVAAVAVTPEQPQAPAQETGGWNPPMVSEPAPAGTPDGGWSTVAAAEAVEADPPF